MTHRLLTKAFKIRAGLGQTSGGILAPYPEKPKGMRWKTYESFKARSMEIEQRLLNGLAGQIGPLMQGKE